MSAQQINSFDIFTSSTTGSPVTVPARIYVGTPPGSAPVAVTSVTVGASPGFYRATLATPLSVNSTLYIGLDMSGMDVYRPELQAGTYNVAYVRANSASTWSLQIARPSFKLNCVPDYEVPKVGNTGRPALGASFEVELADAPPASVALLLQGLSDQVFEGFSLPTALPGAPGCDLLVSADVTDTAPTDASGAASRSVVVPNSAALEGLEVFYQWVVLDQPANALGAVSSDAGRATLGQ